MAEGTQGVNPTDSNTAVSPKLIKNPISLIGVALAAVAVVNIIFLFFIDVLSSAPSPYIGILAYMVGPAFLVLGLLLILVGMALERRRRAKAAGERAALPQIDLNNPAQRSSVAFVLSFVAAFAVLSAAGSYKAYEFTD